MRIGWLLALGIVLHPHPSGAGAPPSLSQREREKPAQPAKGEGDRKTAVDAVARRYALAGELLVAKGDNVLLHRGYGPVALHDKTQHKSGQRWRLASITKQVTAALIVVLNDKKALDTEYIDGLSLRQMLTHHSGLANPDDTPPADGVPSFYVNLESGLEYCLSKKVKPGATFSYNNCDYIVADMLARSGSPDNPDPRASHWPTGMSMARTDELGVPGFVGGKPEPHFQLGKFGAAGGLIGTAQDVYRFDRSLMTGELLSPERLAELWKPEGNGSYQALGQWVFPGQLKGCAAPKRIVQRDGEIQGVQARNYILPDDDLVVIVFTNRSSDDFKLGEVWEGSGFIYELLSAAACP